MKLLAEEAEEQSPAFGGQALIEGVMMRSRKHVVMCVRQPNNEILTHTERINSISERYRVLRLPFLRGIIALFETFYLGFKGLSFSANAVLEEEEKFTLRELVMVVTLALVLASFFFVVPFLLTNLLNLTGLAFNIVEAMVRLAIFLLYLTFIAMWAEYTIFIVVIISILLFSIMPNLGFVARLTYRVLLIPVIGTISYELLKLSDRYKNSTIMRIVTKPGLAFQRLTTREPSEDMIEVAIKAVKEMKKQNES